MPDHLIVIPSVAKPGAGRVHSVYRSTINFTLNSELFSLHPAQTACSPIGFSVARCALPACRVAAPVLWDGRRLQIAEHVFSADRATRFCGKLPAVREAPLPNGARFPLSDAPFGGSDASAAEAAQITRRVSRALACGQWGTAADCACEMLGLGCGLTPSGDDWLTGVLALLHFTSARAESRAFLLALQQRLPHRLSETNDISARFVQLACAGQFAAPLCALFSAWQGGDARAFHAACLRVLGLGHSSGADMLAGIRFLYNP